MQKFYIQALTELSYACKAAAEGHHDEARSCLTDALAATTLIDTTVLTSGSVLEIMNVWKAITAVQGMVNGAEAASLIVKVSFPS